MAVFRIRIRSDPYHLPGSGSGSASGNFDLDPGTKKKIVIQINQNYKNIFKKKRNRLFCLIYAKNELKITTTKNTIMSLKPYTEKIMNKKIGICLILGRIHHPRSGSADPDLDPHQNDKDSKHCRLGYFFYIGWGGGGGI